LTSRVILFSLNDLRAFPEEQDVLGDGRIWCMGVGRFASDNLYPGILWGGKYGSAHWGAVNGKR
jgi:hypothetical protein